ncbi:MAG TPA: hypothetical protein VMS60_07845 [Solirubrobacterales bacterium]|nr:hypothetical protein [Solirubrobacterales bacterium]
MAVAAPANDAFANRQSLGGPLPVEVTGSNVGATHEGAEPSDADIPISGHSVWFEWEATDTEVITVGTCGSDFRTTLSVYTGDELASLTEVVSNQFSFGPDCRVSGRSEATFRAVAGTSYRIRVDGNPSHAADEPPVSGEGAIELSIHSTPPVPNDDFEDAQPLLGEFSVQAPNWAATKQGGEPAHRGKAGGASVWFRWTAPQSKGAFVQACSERIETIVAVYTGSAVGNLDAAPLIEPQSDCEYSFAAKAGVTYLIAVDAEFDPKRGSAEMGETGLSVHMFPGNDDFETAYALGSFPGGTSILVGLRTVGATKQAGEPNHAGNPGGASVWFNWTAFESGSVQISACNANFPTLLAAYTGFSLSNLTEIASRNAQNPGCPLLASKQGAIAFNTEAGTVYRIALDGYGGAWGGFNLEIQTSPDRLKVPPARRGAKRPNTKIKRKRIQGHRGRATFLLAATQPPSSFRCKLDSHPFRPCTPRVRLRHLKPGRHVFMARAVNAAGIDPSPAVLRFTIPKRAHG